MSITEKYRIPPYLGAEYMRKAQKIVTDLINKGSSFINPYTEASIILEIALSMMDKSLELFEEGKDLETDQDK